MIRATMLRVLALTAAFAAAWTPVAGLAQSTARDGKQLPVQETSKETNKETGKDTNKETKKSPPKLPAKATKKLPPEMLTLLRDRKMPLHSPILVRIFKEEAELEVWKQDNTGRFQHLKTYPICRWSGDLGPKLREGDRQTPEGFYRVTPEQMNPHSSYHLSMNIGYPNSFDRANNRDGSLIMIHGDCWSIGCHAMSDEQIGEIYALARESFLGPRQSFQVQAYPFRMTPQNLARHRNNPNLPFWKMLKTGNDHFEATHLEPKVDVCNRAYVFDAQRPPKSRRPFAFKPTGPCPEFVVDPKIAERVLEKQRADALEYARLVESNAPAAPVYSELDGGMNEAFAARFAERVSLSKRIGLDLRGHPVERLMAAHKQMLANGWIDEGETHSPERQTLEVAIPAAPRAGDVAE